MDNAVNEVVVVVAERILTEAPPDTPPRKRQAYLAGLQRKLIDRHADLEQLVQQHDIAHVIELIARRELGEPPEAVKPPGPTHDPACPDCAGSGWRSVEGTNTVAPCDCEPPPLATVTELRRTS